MSIPVVIFHTGGNQLYFINCVNISSKYNTVYLIGDDSNQNTFADNPNVRFFHINDLGSDEIEKFKQCFVNYSTNDHHFEMYCFLRVFYLKSLLEKTNNTWMFHTDSDCVIVENINNILTPPFRTSYFIENTENKYHMVGSIHNALIDLNFCNKFIQLCFDIYDNRTKFGLISNKIEWHNLNRLPGGICDMTLYYLLYSQKIIDDIVNLNMPFSFNGEPIIFGNYILGSSGFNGENTYETVDNIKTIIKQNGRVYFKLVDGNVVKAASIHFQGISNKQILETFSV
jgi:hypothetical protein